jgi:hypothetical protein
VVSAFSVSTNASTTANSFTPFETVGIVQVLPVSGGYKIVMYTPDNSGTWDMSGCTNPAAVVFNYSATNSSGYLSAILTAKSTGTKISVATSTSTSCADPLPVDELRFPQ